MGFNHKAGGPHQKISTPHLDRLAAESVQLTAHYVNPMCTPTRASFMTGLHSFRTGMQFFVLLSSQPTGTVR